MKNYVEINQKWWDQVTPIHAKSSFYNLKNFKKGQSSLFEIEEKELGVVKNKSLLHLMCHFGMDSLSLARKGAQVIGVDFSHEAVKLAQNLSRELKIPAQFINSDIYRLPKILHQKFDIIFASYGVLCWLSDLTKWAKIINHFLKPKGFFYLVDLHPFTNILNCDLKLFYKYFDPGPYLDDSSGTYTNWNVKVKGKTYEWSWTLGDIINIFLEQKLRIEFLHEFPYSMYNQFPGFMQKNKKGQYVLKNKKIEIPLLFSLKVTKKV